MNTLLPNPRIHLRAFLVLMVLSILVTHALAAPVGAGWDDWDVIPGKVLVKFKPAKAQALRARAAQANIPGLSVAAMDEPVERRFAAERPGQKFNSLLPHTFVGTFEHSQRGRILQALANDPDVEYVEPDRTRVASPTWGTSTPNDPSLPLQWGMTRIGAPRAWARQAAQRSAVRLAVMEPGRFDPGHRDLVAQASGVQNHAGAISDHATHVAGIAAATGNNGLDVAGVANVELVGLDTGTSGAGFANQITWAFNNGVRVINMSFKWCGVDGLPGNPCSRCVYPAPSQTEQDALTAASGRIIFVAAANNNSCSVDANGRRPLPAGYTFVNAVSAIDASDNLATFSNFGPYVRFAAPGVNITSTVPVNAVGVDSGTSMATPHVAGTFAAVLAVSGFDLDSLSRLVDLTAEDIGAPGPDDSFGIGVVRVDRAMAGIAEVYAEEPPLPFNRNGTLSLPFDLGQALSRVSIGGTVGLVRTTTQPFRAGAFTLNKPCTLIAVGGPVNILD